MTGGNTSIAGYTYYCGDVQLTGNVTVGSSTTLVIYDGQLDLNNFKLQTGSGVGLTIILAGEQTVTVGSKPAVTITPSHTISDNSASGKGTLDIAAPTKAINSTWSGIAVYQGDSANTFTDAKSTDQKNGGKAQTLDVTAAGSSPNMDLTGVFYFPNAAVELKGAIDQSTNGLKCFVLVSNTLLLDGTGSIFKNAQSQCTQAGVTQVFGETQREALLL